jgi:hypothetical protein
MTKMEKAHMNRSIRMALAFALGLSIFTSAHAGEVTIPNTFTSGTPAVAAEVNANFTAVKTAVDDNDTRIDANGSEIAANTGEIDTNAADIADLTATQAATPRTWHQILTTDRFQLVMNDEAVLDRETGLVWDRSPDTGTRTWSNAIGHCYQREVANRFGWRLPTMEELSTLVDNGNSDPALPANHPFIGVHSASGDRYWTATSTVWIADYAWYATFFNGARGEEANTATYSCWCVRGGHGYDNPF